MFKRGQIWRVMKPLPGFGENFITRGIDYRVNDIVQSPLIPREKRAVIQDNRGNKTYFHGGDVELGRIALLHDPSSLSTEEQQACAPEGEPVYKQQEEKAEESDDEMDTGRIASALENIGEKSGAYITAISVSWNDDGTVSSLDFNGGCNII